MTPPSPNKAWRAWPRAPLIAAGGTALVAVVLLSAAAGGASAGTETISPKRQASLEYLLRQDCGSCHGMTLKGGLGPALLPEALRDRDEDGLVMMILDGNPERAMPPWRGQLSEAEARWLARRLKQGAAK